MPPARPRRPAQRGAPDGTPTIDPGVGTAGLTPQQAIVNPDGTPTMFFFRWLLTWVSQIFTGGAAAGSEISVNGVLAGDVTNGPISVNGIAIA